MINEPIKTQETSEASIVLAPDQTEKLNSAIKIGICKELHRKGLLTDAQLNALISIHTI